MTGRTGVQRAWPLENVRPLASGHVRRIRLRLDHSLPRFQHWAGTPADLDEPAAAFVVPLPHVVSRLLTEVVRRAPDIDGPESQSASAPAVERDRLDRQALVVPCALPRVRHQLGEGERLK